MALSRDSGQTWLMACCATLPHRDIQDAWIEGFAITQVNASPWDILLLTETAHLLNADTGADLNDKNGLTLFYRHVSLPCWRRAHWSSH